jgi:hypothetical protein
MHSRLIETLSRAMFSGASAGVASALVAAAGASKSGHRPYSAMNAVAHCIWPEQAPKEEAPSVRFTAVGSGIHLGSAVFWGVLFETLCTSRACPRDVVAAAIATSVTAYVVDYHVVPKRFTPGYEARLSKHALGSTYVALGAGFAMVALARMGRSR